MKKEELRKENERLRQKLSAAYKQLEFRQQGQQDLTGLVIDDSMFPIVIVAWESAKVLYINRYARDFFGVDEADASDKTATDFFYSKEILDNFLEALRREGKVFDYELVFLDQRKLKKDAVVSARLVEYNNQKALYAVFSDITSIKQAQKAFQESEDRFHQLYNLVKLMADNQPDLLWAKDLDDNYLFANAAIRNKLLMCGDEDPIGKNDIYFAKRERGAGHQHTFGEICINSDEVVKQTMTQDRFLEDGLVRGKYLALDVYKAPMFDNHGKLIGTVGAGRNVTRDIAVQKALEESEKRFRLLANNLRDVLWISDLKFKPTYVTPSIHRLSGYTAEEFLEIPVQNHMLPKYRRKFERLLLMMDTVIRNRKKLSQRFFEFECEKKDGSQVWVEINVSVMRDRLDQPIGLTGMIRDCTKRINQQQELKVTREEALAASKAKSEFLANMSHELRTPLNGVLGILQLLMDSSLTKVQKRYVETALTAGGSLLKIISDILDFSKIEAGCVELDSRVFKVDKLVTTILASFQNLVDKESVTLEHVINEDVPVYVAGDEQRLQQVLFNLVGNAVKFTKSGNVTVRVSCAEILQKQQVRLQFGVHDTGVGIPEEIIGRLFEPFVQEDASIRRKFGGTGLGLSIVKSLVDLMGGDIQLTSILGKGTKVNFDIIVGLSTPVRDVFFLPQHQVQHSKSSIKILVVEDETINAMVISAMLKQHGHKVTIASSGVEALEILEATHFDCIFMDIQMPDMDGVETTKIIRERLQYQIPIIALTAHAIKGDKERFIAAGMDDYISKPVSVERLTTVLSQLASSN